LARSAVEQDQRGRTQRALIDLVAERGYEKVTVRDLTKLAHISTETFYARFHGKDECFARTYAAGMERVVESVSSTRSHELDGAAQLRRAVEGLAGALAADRKTARLLLIDAYSGGPSGLVAIGGFERDLAKAFCRSLDRREARVPLPTAAWISAGLLRAARSSALTGRLEALHEALNSLIPWADSHLRSPAPCSFGRFGASADGGSGPAHAEASGHPGEVELILAAVIKRAQSQGYRRLTLSAVCRAAGLSQNKFTRHFDDLEHCFLAALSSLAARFFGRWTAGPSAGGPGRDWLRAAHEALLAVPETAVKEPGLATLLFDEMLEPGAKGMRCREEIVGDLARAWLRWMPRKHSPRELEAEATVAAWWNALAEDFRQGGAQRVAANAPSYERLLLAPLAGRREPTAAAAFESTLRPNPALLTATT
jgi:AcrR family transcriptional regulator